MKNILFVSSANLTVNPRLKKELLLAVENGYNVFFVGLYSGNWSDEIDKNEIKSINANFNYISVTRKPFFKWFLITLIEKISQKLYFVFKNNLKLNAFAHSKRSFLLYNFLKKDKNKYDLVVGHTFATLYPTYLIAKKQNIPFIFDIEDYHPGEVISKDAKNEKKRREFLMKTILPKASYITYASPLIGEHSLKLLENYPQNKHCLINNSFSQSEFQFKENNSEKIKFVWFSQNIAAGRGLELLVPELYKFKDKIELTLIGNLYQNFYDIFLKQYSEILKIEKPLPQKDLNLKLSDFDVGLAIELQSADFNRDICLTNKIFAYSQSGLFVFATDTQSQKLFISENQNIGIISNQNPENINEKLSKTIQNIVNIRNSKFSRFEYCKKFAFENESKKIVDIWNSIL